MIATYNEDESVAVMTAGWGTLLKMEHLVLTLAESHKTVKNILARKAFTVSLADVAHMVEADYFGIVSASNTGDKFAKSGMTAMKSAHVDAPVILEFPLCMECELVEYKEGGFFCLVIGKVVDVCVEESVLTDGKVAVEKLSALAVDPFTRGYYKVSERVGDAFKDGLKLK